MKIRLILKENTAVRRYEPQKNIQSIIYSLKDSLQQIYETDRYNRHLVIKLNYELNEKYSKIENIEHYLNMLLGGQEFEEHPMWGKTDIVGILQQYDFEIPTMFNNILYDTKEFTILFQKYPEVFNLIIDLNKVFRSKYDNIMKSHDINLVDKLGYNNAIEASDRKQLK